MLNRVVLMGRLTADPELKKTTSDLSVLSFTVAVESQLQRQQRQTDRLHQLRCMEQTAEFISRYFSKGKMIALEGSIQVRNYTDKNDNKRQAVEVLVSQAYFAGDNSQKQGPAADTKNYPPITYVFGKLPKTSPKFQRKRETSRFNMVRKR